MKMLKLMFAITICLAYSTCIYSQIVWKNPTAEDFPTVHGQAWSSELKGFYHRLPQRAESKVRKPLWDLSTNSAGLSVVFRTNATNIQVRYQINGDFSMPHMPATGKSGVDLYATEGIG